MMNLFKISLFNQTIHWFCLSNCYLLSQRNDINGSLPIPKIIKSSRDALISSTFSLVLLGLVETPSDKSTMIWGTSFRRYSGFMTWLTAVSKAVCRNVLPVIQFIFRMAERTSAFVLWTPNLNSIFGTEANCTTAILVNWSPTLIVSTKSAMNWSSFWKVS